MNVREIVTSEFVKAIEQGICPWVRPWSTCQPMNVEGRKYTGVNAFLLSWLPYPDPRYITFNQAKNLGGYVKEGEHGHLVVFYTTYKGKDEQDETRRVLRYYRVFNVSQVEGLDLKPLNLKQSEFNPLQKAEEIDAMWIDKPIVEYGGNHACYNQILDKITVPEPERFTSPAEFYSTKFHEFGHATGHHSRLDRFSEKDNPAKDYGREELVAEMTSAFLMKECGIDDPNTQKNSAAYLNAWLKNIQEDPNLITWAAAKAAKAADYIIGRNRASTEVEDLETATA